MGYYYYLLCMNCTCLNLCQNRIQHETAKQLHEAAPRLLTILHTKADYQRISDVFNHVQKTPNDCSCQKKKFRMRQRVFHKKKGVFKRDPSFKVLWSRERESSWYGSPDESASCSLPTHRWSEHYWIRPSHYLFCQKRKNPPPAHRRALFWDMPKQENPPPFS